jgi:hypothetical protein
MPLRISPRHATTGCTCRLDANCTSWIAWRSSGFAIAMTRFLPERRSGRQACLRASEPDIVFTAAAWISTESSRTRGTFSNLLKASARVSSGTRLSTTRKSQSDTFRAFACPTLSSRSSKVRAPERRRIASSSWLIPSCTATPIPDHSAKSLGIAELLSPWRASNESNSPFRRLAVGGEVSGCKLGAPVSFSSGSPVCRAADRAQSPPPGRSNQGKRWCIAACPL